MLLLHFMAIFCPQRVRAIYVDHQLQQPSQAWGQLVAEQCRQLNIPCIIQPVQVASGNLENQARSARYQAFQQHLKSHEVLVLAHHQQDQAETVLLRLFSGAGIHGLAAMREVEQRDHYTLWRPFLSLTREQIAAWTAQLNLPYVDDPSNQDTHYDRAWCRKDLWPMLQSRFPQMQQAVARSSYLMQDAEDILQDVVQDDWQRCGDSNQLNLQTLDQLSVARRRQLLSAWMKGEGQYRPPFEMVQRLQAEVIGAQADAQAALHWNQYYYVRFQGHIYRLAQASYLASKQQPPADQQQICFSPEQIISLPAGNFRIQSAQVGLAWNLLGQNLQLNFRQGGEKIHLHGRVGRWPLKKAIQEAQIFPWLRHTIQIISIDNVMLGVFTPKGFWLAQSVYCEAGGWQPNLISQP